MGGLTAGGVVGVALIPKGSLTSAAAAPAEHAAHQTGVQAVAAAAGPVAPFGTVRMPVPYGTHDPPNGGPELTG